MVILVYSVRTAHVPRNYINNNFGTLLHASHRTSLSLRNQHLHHVPLPPFSLPSSHPSLLSLFQASSVSIETNLAFYITGLRLRALEAKRAMLSPSLHNTSVHWGVPNSLHSQRARVTPSHCIGSVQGSEYRVLQSGH